MLLKQGIFTTIALIALTATARSESANGPLADLVGHWDLVGTTIRVKIHSDATIDHSRLGAGTIREVEADVFRFRYRHQDDLQCEYRAARYSQNELHLVVVTQPSPQDCELGAMRRAPGSEVKSPAASIYEKDLEIRVRPNIGAHTLPTTVFKDCDRCPDMVVVPAGAFLMGSPDGEAGRYPVEGPIRAVTIQRPFAIGRYHITVRQFREFVTATNRTIADDCHVEGANDFVPTRGLSFAAPGFLQTEWHPVVCVSWEDAAAYAAWLAGTTGKPYRLLSEAELEYAARAGTATRFWWGDKVDRLLARFDMSASGSSPTSTASQRDGSALLPKPNQARTLPQSATVAQSSGTVAVTSGRPNPWGIFHVHGNAASWAADCWSTTLIGAPVDGSPASSGDCTKRSIRGGAWTSFERDMRASYRESAPMANRYYHVGFRIGLSLAP